MGYDSDLVKKQNICTCRHGDDVKVKQEGRHCRGHLREDRKEETGIKSDKEFPNLSKWKLGWKAPVGQRKHLINNKL